MNERPTRPAQPSHAAILDELATMRREHRDDMHQVFGKIDDVKLDVGEVKEDVANLSVKVGFLEGVRDGRAEAAREGAGALLSAPRVLGAWEKVGIWAAALAALVGILSGLAQAVHTGAGVALAVYHSLQAPSAH